ncbi:MAG: histidinol dehydrogenase [Saccharofermentanales bacterium]|jgi:histidinol dehydrogenase|nr:histidinol dehydrogenase [Clostridiaceae bacterium]
MSTGDEQSRVVLRILRTDRSELASVVNRLGMRGKMDLEPVVTATKAILEEVRGKGDEALLALTERFDQARLTVADLPVGEAEISMALDQVDIGLLDILRQAAENISKFHQAQRPVDVDIDGKISLINRPLAKVGVYVPGGTAPLPSSVLMNIIPARAAGVEKIIMCTPPRADSSIDPVILAAAFIAGADEIYRIGGAQAIAAMAYGTRTIPKVDKITGPGNIYVNTAKRLVFGQVDIDMFAGPSEILIIADETADSSYVAADLLSQAEHDVLASALLVTTSEQLAEAVVSETARRAALLPRKHIIARSLNDFGAVLLVPDLATAVEFANELAPEHLELMVAEPDDLLPRIRNAGAIFVGSYSPEPLGDYFAGTNHVLPTSGTARFFSPLNTGDFIKKINLIRYTREDLAKDWRAIAEFAEAENLRAHAESVRVRFGADQLAGL